MGHKLLDKLSYTSTDSNRDLRIDFIRGVVMLILIINHLEFKSWYNFLFSERIGIVSGGEGFVILAGVVIGMINRKRLEINGFVITTNKLIDRASTLYMTNISIILIIAVLSFVPMINTSSVQTFVDKPGKIIYSLYPKPLIDSIKIEDYSVRFEKDSVAFQIPYLATDNIQTIAAKTVLLRIGPHQYQIMGLYVLLLFLTPLALLLMKNKRTALLLALSWILYLKNWAFPITGFPPGITGCQFESGFPLLTWQLIFFNGMAVGYHKDKLVEIMKGRFRFAILTLSWVLFLFFLFLAQNNPDPEKVNLYRFAIIDTDLWGKLYSEYFQKNTLGILRLVNYFAVLMVSYHLLTKFWRVFDKSLGWFFVPIGQSSLYVFIIHIFIVLLINQFPQFWDNMLFGTLGHTLALTISWLMVKYKILFNIIPR
ncbi:MAG: OpgC domain-containing protein [Candidatus Kapabacteria bacterium]|nr:OpgC domain-containing protein [Candidatus Kapabacteria bacterium]